MGDVNTLDFYKTLIHTENVWLKMLKYLFTYIQSLFLNG